MTDFDGSVTSPLLVRVTEIDSLAVTGFSKSFKRKTYPVCLLSSTNTFTRSDGSIKSNSVGDSADSTTLMSSLSNVS